MTFTKRQCALLLVIATVTAYLNTLHNSFVWDDEVLVTENSYIRNSTYLSTVFTTDLVHNVGTGVAYYRPLQTVSYMLDYFLWGLNPFGYHLTNLLLHLTCVLLLWSWLRQLRVHPVVALVTATLFAVHPVNTNAVTYISGRADSLAFMGMLGSLLCWVRYRARADESKWVCAVLYATAMGCFVVALFSRENALLLPFLVLLHCLILERGDHSGRKVLAIIAPFVLVAAAFLLWRQAVLATQPKPSLPPWPFSMGIRLQIPFRALATYCGLLLCPVHLQMDRQVLIGGWWLHFLTLTGLIVAAVIVVIIRWSYRRAPIVCFGSCWFLVTLLPVSGLLNLTAPVAEHWLYVPAVGFWMALTSLCLYGLGQLQGRAGGIARRAAAVGCIILLAALAARTVVRNADWVNPLTLYSKTEKAAPYSERVHNNLGRELRYAGQWQQARNELLTAERLTPYSAQVEDNLAALYLALGDLANALAKTEEILRHDPNNTAARLRLAVICEQRGDFAAAWRQYLRAMASNMEIRPRLVFGSFLLRNRRFSEALKVAAEAYDIEPGHAEVFNLLGVALTELGQYDKGEEAFRMAVGLDRHSANGFVNLGHAEFRRGNVSAAIAHYRRALCVQPNDGRALYQLGAAYWRLGNSRAAIQELEHAQQLLPDNRIVRDALEDVRQGKPYTPPAVCAPSQP